MSQTTEGRRRVRTEPGPPVVEAIHVHDLFGRLSYDLAAPRDPSVVLLYGDNGSGKTTILQAIFHLLSASENRGHRSALAKVPFRRIAVEFRNGQSVSAERRGSQLTGTYWLTVGGPGPTVTVRMQADEGGSVIREQNAPALTTAAKALNDIGLNVLFLSDDRHLHGDAIPREPPRADTARYFIGTQAMDAPAVIERAERSERDTELEAALRRSVAWVQQHTLLASSTGETSANNIYIEIIRRLLRPAGRPPKQESSHELPDRIEQLGARLSGFTRFGLASDVTFERLVPALRRATTKRLGTVQNVLSPYLDVISARLDALEPTQKALAQFVDGVNAFYAPEKELVFRVREGISIKAGGESLLPRALSSGEKQLLLMFCSMLWARDRPSLFIIDEPELSLNVKWQRSLIDSLTSIVGGLPTQFLMATHSLEILSGHSDRVVELTAKH